MDLPDGLHRPGIKETSAAGLTLAQYALRWILRRREVTSVIVGASSVAQLSGCLGAL